MWAKFQPWRATELMLAPSEPLDNRRFDLRVLHCRTNNRLEAHCV